MKKTTKLRIFGGVVLLFNLWLIGHYNLSGIPVLLLTFGFAIAYELVVVRPLTNGKAQSQEMAASLGSADPPPKPSASPSTSDFGKLKEMAQLPESERRKQCWACHGDIPSCTICAAREAKIRDFLSAWT